MNAVSQKTANDYKAMAKGRTITALYNCHIIDVHPETLSVDVVILKTAKTIENIALNSAFFSKDISEIIIPEVGAEAIFASTSDGSPFIVAYKQPLRYERDGFENQKMLSGEIARTYKKKSFYKADNSGSQIFSSGNGDMLRLGDNSIDLISADISVMAMPPAKCREYTVEEIIDDIPEGIVNTSKEFLSIFSEDGIFSQLKNIDNVFRNSQEVQSNIVDKVNDAIASINEILGEHAVEVIEVTKDGVLFGGQSAAYRKFNEFVPITIEQEAIDTYTTSNEEGFLYKATKYICEDDKGFNLEIYDFDSTKYVLNNEVSEYSYANNVTISILRNEVGESIFAQKIRAYDDMNSLSAKIYYYDAPILSMYDIFVDGEG